jgi:hypothetical protein
LIKKNFNNKLLNLKIIFLKTIQLKKIDSIFICSDFDRGYFKDGKYYSPILDFINELLINKGLQTISIDSCYSKIKPINKFGNPKNINLIHFLISFCNYVSFLFYINHQKRISIIRLYIWKFLFKFINPKSIFAIQPSIEMCIAAKKLNIWIADVQHGVISGEGYYGIKYRSKYLQNGWPTVVLCWNNNSADWIKKHCGSYTTTNVIGNPWHHKYYLNKDHYIDNDLTVPKILITLNHSLNNNNIYNKLGLNLFLANYIKKCDDKYTWLIRLHPVSLKILSKNDIEKIFLLIFKGQKNVEWSEPSFEPLPKVLANVNLHITLSSAVVIESAMLGIKSALLSEKYDEVSSWFKKEIEDGMAEFVSQEELSMDNWINDNINLKIKTKNNYFYENNELLKIISTLFNINGE